ncbi:MAG: phosphoribosylformylglycinamidine synthase [Candidatus Nomurabacteria bacterium]|jgi:phosphoribosylformylglycinamidine synthase|nr:phosphoribosylformylglycinamidine synthase [Candidatus Nomurabacteria bacterium]
MLTFFRAGLNVFVVESKTALEEAELEQLKFFLNYQEVTDQPLPGYFVGPRRSIETPESTNAVSAIGNSKISRVEKYEVYQAQQYDQMLQEVVELDKNMFFQRRPYERFRYVEDIEELNESAGLALSYQEIAYLYNLKEKSGHLTDAEITLFAQINSEHSRHKKFNGHFYVNDRPKPYSLFDMIKQTFAANPNTVVSAYKDNAAAFGIQSIDLFGLTGKYAIKRPSELTYITVKAETHNHPTGVSAFPGGATGTGGEIRDRMAVGRGSWPLAGGAAYFVPELRLVETYTGVMTRDWLYQTPLEILVRASDGASDFGNKIGQPLINGSVLTFEQVSNGAVYSYDKPIMLANGIGLVKSKNLDKVEPAKGMAIVLLGGKNYRIGIGGATSSSVNLGAHNQAIELNSVQRADPEMQRRVLKVVEYFARDSSYNPILSIHDHGAGGHGNCFSELVGEAGGEIWLDALPIGDPSLTYSEIIINESQERMGLLIAENDWPLVQRVAERENCPAYLVGKITGNGRFVFRDRRTNDVPFNMSVADLFANPPKTIIRDKYNLSRLPVFHPGPLKWDKENYVYDVLQRAEVGSKDYLVRKADRSVGGLVVQQQCVGPLQVPVADYGLVKKSYFSDSGIAMSMGSAPVLSFFRAGYGAEIALVEALTNIVLSGVRKLSDVVLSANWMWPSGNEGEDARLYEAVESLSQLAQELGICIPVGKDSLSMTQNYPDGSKVIAPGTVVITAVADVPDVRKHITPQLNVRAKGTKLIYVPFVSGHLALQGSSLALSQNQLGFIPENCTGIQSSDTLKAFEQITDWVDKGLVLAGHDVSGGGIVTTLLEMCFAQGLDTELVVKNKFLHSQEAFWSEWQFTEMPGVILQVKNEALKGNQYPVLLADKIGRSENGVGRLKFFDLDLDLAEAYAYWSRLSELVEEQQIRPECRSSLLKSRGAQSLMYNFHKPKLEQSQSDYPILAAVIRDEGTNGEREMQYTLTQAGFTVKDVHMTDLMEGHENLEEFQVIVFAGGFSNSDVLGSAVGWAGKFRFNRKAKRALHSFMERPDTLILGICNGCQLMAKLGIITGKPGATLELKPNFSGKFESAYINVDIPKTNSVWLQGLAGSRLGIWVAHGEGRFALSSGVDSYNVAVSYSYSDYPGNHNGSDFDIAGISSWDGRHLAMMPHPERTISPLTCADYPKARRNDPATPWLKMFVNAYNWCSKTNKSTL